jgi:peptidylprolyl isomerase domain and WD repeat-containing protein 1
MSELEQHSSMLGKRARNGMNEATGNIEDIEENRPVHDDDDDNDDVGPMPMPMEAVDGSVKKKRKGVFITLLRVF